MKRNKPIAMVVIIMVVMLIGCASTRESGFMAPEGEMTFSRGMAEDSADSAVTEINQNSQELGQIQERLIIRSGQLDIVVRNTEESLEEINQMADRMGGWVLSSHVYQRGDAMAGTIIIRIPAEHFDRGMSQIKEAALEVRTESTDSQDVTEEYVDLEARLVNLEATADRIRNFLDEAQNVEEALAVNRELSRLEGEIESIKGRIQFLSQSAAFSSLTVDLSPDEPSQPIEVAGWRPEGVAKSAIESLISAFQGLADIAIWGFIFCLPLGLLVGIPLFFIGRFAYRRRVRRKSTDEEE